MFGKVALLCEEGGRIQLSRSGSVPFGGGVTAEAEKRFREGELVGSQAMWLFVSSPLFLSLLDCLH